MSNYYILTFDSNRQDLDVVDDYDLPDFDVRSFWHGERLEEQLPASIRITLRRGEPADYLGTPISWPIISIRLWERIRDLVERHCQIIGLPLYDSVDGSRVDDYVIMNVTTVIRSLAPENWGRTKSIQNLKVDGSKIPSGVDLFRLAESPTILIVSEVFAERLRQIHPAGVALISTEVR